MTVLGIFGDGTASEELVTAALNDILEAHLADHGNEEFWLCIGVRKPTSVYEALINWALYSGMFVAVYTKFDSPGWQASFDGGEFEVGEWHHSDKWMLDVVDRLLAEREAKVYALLGDEDPPVDVRRALVRALDNRLEVRDLAEAGLTVVGVSDNPIQTMRSNIMANKDLTITEAGEAADNEDEESMQALTELAAEYDLDPDEYETWSDLAAAIKPLLEAEPEPEPDVDEAPKGRSQLEELTREELEALPVPELRNLAKQLGVEGHDKNRSAKLIEGIMEAQGGGGEAPQRRSSRNGDEISDDTLMSILARGLRAFADALEA